MGHFAAEIVECRGNGSLRDTAKDDDVSMVDIYVRDHETIT